MFSRTICLAFLSFSLFSSAVQGAPTSNGSGEPDLVVRTVAVSAQASSTGSSQNGNKSTVVTSASGGSFTATATKSASAIKGVSTTSVATSAKAANNSKSSTASATTTARGAANTNTGKKNGDPQKSLTLDPRVIAPGFANDGQNVPAPGQVKSLTSVNNFINFCLTAPNLLITNGKQITAGSCNPAPIGVIPSIDNMPSSKFSSPKNFATIKANKPFTIEMAIRKFQAGFFVNAQANYFAAPQTLNGQGQIKGHSHVVVEQLSAIDQTTPADPKKFAFFKGLNAPAVNGKLTADVTTGLPAGFYKLSSINSAANHQPVIVPVAQHGSLDDVVYFTVTVDGKPLPGSTGAGAGGKASASSVAASSASGKAAATTNKVAASATNKVTASATDKVAASATSKAAATATGVGAGASSIAAGKASASSVAASLSATGKAVTTATSKAA